jgi:hypothetical protein
MKARIANPEKTSVARQQDGKHVSIVVNNHATTVEWLEPKLDKENQLEFSVNLRM